MINPLIIDGMKGLGDNVYLRPIIKQLAQRHRNRCVYLTTPWPQLFHGIDVKFLPSGTTLRTQRKNEGLSIQGYSVRPLTGQVTKLTYAPLYNRGMPIYESLVTASGFTGSYFLDLDIPEEPRKPTAIIRPATFRREWPARSRNPRQEYLQIATHYLKTKGLVTIVVADVDGENEVYDGPKIDGADVYYVRGELSVMEMVSLFNRATIVVGGVGFIAPLCQALGTPAVIIHGGAGGWNAPHLIDCPAKGKLTHVLPERYCKCRSHQHNCDKFIKIEKIVQAIDSII